MCGIAGIIEMGGSPVDPDKINGMLTRLVHRGPDHIGVWYKDHVALGCARLRIIDLYTGDQPISNEKSDIILVCNGEISNYIELRENLIRKGHCFRTNSDVEVLLHLYEESSSDFLNDVNGQFAFAIYDIKRDILILGRDRVGICPLFFTEQGGKFAFSSEIKGIFSLKEIRREFSVKGIQQALIFWNPVPPQTVFKGIFQLPPGEILTLSVSGQKRRRYWS